MRHLITTLADARLLTTSDNTVAISHEALLREWPDLRHWLDEDREILRVYNQLSEATKEWLANEKDSGYLLTGAQLSQVEVIKDQLMMFANEDEQSFLMSSQSAKRRSALVGWGAILFGIGFVFR